MTELIYCADGNPRFPQIADRYGFTYGAQLPNSVSRQPEFTDQDWKNPNRVKYMAALKKYRPRLATVLDYDENASFEAVMSWAHEAAMWVKEAVIIIPKIPGTISRIPQFLPGGVNVRLGYSVPTRYGGTHVPVWEFGTRPVHLLGGHPRKQYELRQYLNVVSADTNYHNKMATRYNQYFAAGMGAIHEGVKDRAWPRLAEVYGKVEHDAPYMAFELSCMNMRAMWAGASATVRFALERDIPAIQAIAYQYRDELGRVMRPALQESMARRSLLVAEQCGRVVGFVNYRARRDGGQTIYEIAVHKDFRGQKIGAGLLAAVPRPVRLKCTEDNDRGNAFYKAAGFEITRIEQGKKRRLFVWEAA